MSRVESHSATGIRGTFLLRAMGIAALAGLAVGLYLGVRHVL